MESLKGKVMTDNSIIIDMKTTGPDPEKDEILYISIIRPDGEILFDSFIQPEREKKWPETNCSCGITARMVADAPVIEQVKSRLVEILSYTDVIIGYDLHLIMSFLWSFRISFHPLAEMVDVKRILEEIPDPHNDGSEDESFRSLLKFKKYFSADRKLTSKQTNGRIADCKATLLCWKMIQDRFVQDPEKRKIIVVMKRKLRARDALADDMRSFLESKGRRAGYCRKRSLVEMINEYLDTDTFDEVADIARMGLRTSDVEALLRLPEERIRDLTETGILRIKHIRKAGTKEINIYDAKTVMQLMEKMREEQK